MLKSRKSIENIITQIEKDAKIAVGHNPKESRVKDLHQCVPEPLKRRLERILPEEFMDFLDPFEIDETQLKEEERNLGKEIAELMPTLDDVLEERDIPLNEMMLLLEADHKKLDLDIEQTPKTRREQKQVNWIADYYLQQLKSHRVKWKSKLYQDNPKKWFDKPLIENGL